jgi:hypothetical protein
MFAYSQKAPAAGYGADSRKLLQDTVKQVREEMGIEYAKIGQCNEDCLAKRRKDESTYSSHVYGRNGFRVLMHGVLGRPDGRMVESVAAKSNNKLQGLRLNKELEPLDMSNANCQGALARPIAIYLFPIKEEFHGRRKQLAADTERYNRAQNAGRCSKDASDMQQEGEDDETHAKRPKFLQRERQSASMSAPDKKNAKRPKQEAKVNATPPMQPMWQSNGRYNKYLGAWSTMPTPTEHRAKAESKYLIGIINQQLGCNNRRRRCSTRSPRSTPARAYAEIAE